MLHGDPSKAEFYSILLFVPANTTIQAHSHRDDRMATVVSGNWQFGYGSRFDEKALKTLAPGSVYSEPKGKDHFARTGSESVIVQISGYGPTDLSDDVLTLTGQGPLSVQEFVRKNAAAFTASANAA